MRNEENDCIRYLMKEMDPSEELLMERAMMEDEDLLIEVESMRQTLQKLDKLPEVDPPKHLTQSVLKKASEYATKKQEQKNSFKPAFKYAVAATLALTISAGGAWFFIGPSSGENQQQTAISRTHTEQQADVPDETGQSSRNVTAVSQNSKVEPWVDRNDILRYEDQFLNRDGQFQAIIKRSTEKLQLIENPSVRGGQVNPIQLTGSAN